MPSAQRANPSASLTDPRGRPEPVPIIDGLPPDPRARLSAKMARLELDPGVTFMHEGEVTQSLTVIVRGRVALRLRVPERGAVTILTLDPGDLVGWSGIVPPYRATTSATTLEPTELAVFDAAELRELLVSDAELAAAFLPPVLETVAARVAATRDQLLDLFRGVGVDPLVIETAVTLETEAPHFLPRNRFDDLLAALAAGGRRVVGPTVTDGAIVFADLAGAADLPAGWTLKTAPGRARMERLPDGPGAARIFQYPVSGEGIKRFTFPSRVDALSIETAADGTVRVKVDAPAEPVPLAIVGARACDLAALAVHDGVLAGGPAVDPDYAARRRDLLIVAVECAVAGSTCFCASMGTGPEVTTGADLVLGELDDGFVVRAPTPAGQLVLAGLDLAPAGDDVAARAIAEVARTRSSMGTGAVPANSRSVLMANLESPRWDAIAERCIACANCTLVCPTCFCTGVEVQSGFDGGASSAIRTWDSCFTEGFAQVAGGSFRPRHKDRYRQWLTHKFATWWDQFGTSGCIGCGRCIAWCPVGIDVRTELHAIAGTAPAPAAAPLPRHDVIPLPQVSQDALEFTPATVVSVSPETADTATLRLATKDPRILAGAPGQFVMVGVPAFAIPPISISRFHPDGLELTIRAAGASTSFLTKLRRGATLALRGPLGRGWPVEDAYGRDVVIVAGGIGLAPLRPVIDAVLRERDRFQDVRIYLGARTPRERLFVEEIDALAAREDVLVRVTVDRAGPEWLGRVGIVTQLFKTVRGTGADATAFICGPERMMAATADVLGDLGVPRTHTWVTLERHMECGVGLCGHCQLGTRFVCKDGPVFSVAELGEDLRREGL